MNKDAKIVVSYILGLVMGSGIGAFVAKGYFEKKANERADLEIESMKKRYLEGKNEEESSENEKTEEKPSQNTPESVRKALISNFNKPSLSELHERVMAEIEHPRDDVEEDDISDDSDESDEERESDLRSEDFKNYYEKNKLRPPKIISVKDLGDYPEEFDETEWIYYNVDDVMATEDGEVIYDYERFIGDSLDKFDFRNNGEESLLVVSFEYATIYEITKMFRAYSEVYSGALSEYGEEINKSWEEGN